MCVSRLRQPRGARHHGSGDAGGFCHARKSVLAEPLGTVARVWRRRPEDLPRPHLAGRVPFHHDNACVKNTAAKRAKLQFEVDANTVLQWLVAAAEQLKVSDHGSTTKGSSPNRREARGRLFDISPG